MTTPATTVDDQALLRGLRDAAATLPTSGSHPDLLTIRDDLGSLTDRVEAPPTGALLEAYDTFQQRLAHFRESAREAAVAHDGWSVRGGEGPDPSAAYARGDLLTSDQALTTLHQARATATGVPVNTGYSMYTPEGDAAVHEQIVALATLIAGETLSPRQMSATIRERVADVARVHGEVHDTEPEWDIVDALNPLLERAGYAPIGRDDL